MLYIGIKLLARYFKLQYHVLRPIPRKLISFLKTNTKEVTSSPKEVTKHMDMEDEVDHVRYITSVICRTIF